MLQSCILMLQRVPFRDIFPILPSIAIAFFAYQQWAIARRASKRDFSARILSAFGKIQPLHSRLLEMLRLEEGIQLSEKFSNVTHPATFNKLARLRLHREEFQSLFEAANTGSVECTLLLGVHRNSVAWFSANPEGGIISSKLTNYLGLASKVHATLIVKASSWESDGLDDSKMPNVDSPRQASEELRKLHFELLNLISARIDFNQ